MQGILSVEHRCGTVLGSTTGAAQPTQASASSAPTEPSATESNASAPDSTAAAIAGVTRPSVTTQPNGSSASAAPMCVGGEWSQRATNRARRVLVLQLLRR